MIAECPNGQICPPTRMTNSTCTTDMELRRPGDYCDESIGIMCTTSCKYNHCTGLKIGDMCNFVYDCLGYAYCEIETSTCQLLKQEGQACSFDFECNLGSLCDGAVCMRYFNKPNGNTTASFDSFGLSWGCSSGFSMLNVTTGLNDCALAPVSDIPTGETLPLKCEPGTFCKSKDGKY
jgi:hypothetical protein